MPQKLRGEGIIVFTVNRPMPDLLAATHIDIVLAA
jgi:hypothetical protein